jgi:hypothetical protein
VSVSLEEKQAVIKYLSDEWTVATLAARIEDMGFVAEAARASPRPKEPRKAGGQVSILTNIYIVLAG